MWTNRRPIEPTGDSQSPNTNRDQSKFIDALQYEDESLKSVQEIERETCEARHTRRTTLQKKYSSEHKKNEMAPSSIDIRRLEMNIYLKRPLEIDQSRLVKLHKNRNILIEVVRQASLRLKNYTNVFLMKADMLLNIMVNLFVQYQKRVDKIYYTFQNLDDCLLP